MFESILQTVAARQETLSEQKAEQAMNIVMQGEASPLQIASFLTALHMRGETIEEIIGFVRSLRSHMTTVNGPTENLIDMCGTGGDASGTFNISTASSLLVSSLGVPVAKHGNFAVSSKSGSADVLNTLGIDIQQNAEEAKQGLAKHHMSFLFAPLYHQAMKHAVAPRKELGFRTVFNILGPMANPLRCRKQLIGVYDFEQAKKMAKALRELGSEHVLLVTGEDGLDEITITGRTNVVELCDGDIHTYQIEPAQFNVPTGRIEDILARSPEDSARIITDVLKGKGEEAATNIVALNAGAALYVADDVSSIEAGIERAQQALRTGQGYAHLEKMMTKKAGDFHVASNS
ncbi:anthranilate phosphoribosyltransferase [Bacillaceae bacterium SIJ1]|uniref:anthranilate phosphoribosyltransferase n=1 Tax=Litoribacterium kuwaitense TaxID=1398745 RepID=UPI0013EC1B7D|nr:anthranilate phosphoribosyltransferase [Litoribacterium kuwaitense]NGP43711.1 anthranilate phosphoribosyltransferase [Litoribacterium kuwaitense]